MRLEESDFAKKVLFTKAEELEAETVDQIDVVQWVGGKRRKGLMQELEN
jgi:hypothetical protein